MKLMKKVLAFSLVLIMLVALVSCGKSDFQKLNEKLAAENPNYKIAMKIAMTGANMEMTMELDGKKVHGTNIPLVGEIYSEETNEGSWGYFYDEDAKKWYKSFTPKAEEDEEDTMMPFDLNTLKEEDFEKKDGKYVLKAEKAKDYEVTEMTITIGKGAKTATIEAKGDMGGMTASMTVTISEFGKVSVKLPEAEEIKEDESF